MVHTKGIAANSHTYLPLQVPGSSWCLVTHLTATPSFPIYIGIGTMPKQSQLQGLPQVGQPPSTPAQLILPSHNLGETSRSLGSGVTLPLSSLPVVPLETPRRASGDTHGAYVGEGFPPAPAKLASKIRQGDFTEIGELLSEFWSAPREDYGGTLRPDGEKRRSRLVTDMFTRLQCFSMYVSIRASHSPAMLPELMAYMSHIIRVHQDYAGLAWVCFDTAFRPVINPTCLTRVARATTRCEICLASYHSTRDCAQQGNPDPGVLDWVRTLESMVWSVSPRTSSSPSPLENRQPLVEICRLWNRNRCSYPRCRYHHAHLVCKGDHPAVACPKRDRQPLPARKLPASSI